MTRSRLAVVGAVALLLGATVVLREATMAVQLRPDRGAALALVLDPDGRYADTTGERAKTLALTRLCALRVDASLVDESVRDLPGGRLEVLVHPAVRGVEREELRGCIEDLRVRRLLVDVESMRQVSAPGVATGERAAAGGAG